MRVYTIKYIKTTMLNEKKDTWQSIPNARGFNENGGKSYSVISPCLDNSLYPFDKRSTESCPQICTKSCKLECLFASGHTANPPSTVPTAAKQTFRRSRRKDTYPFALIIDIIRSMALMRIMSRVLCEGQISLSPAFGWKLQWQLKLHPGFWTPATGKTQTN